MSEIRKGRPRTKRDEAGRALMIPAFGPAIPIVPRKDFNCAVTQDQLEFFWRITGPSAMNNINSGHPMWAVIACAYAEGLHHATKLLAEQHKLVKDPIKVYKEVPIRGKSHD